MAPLAEPGRVLVASDTHRALTLADGRIALEVKRHDGEWARIFWVKDEAVARLWVEA